MFSLLFQKLFGPARRFYDLGEARKFQLQNDIRRSTENLRSLRWF